jgi:hypothetical protein
VSRSNEDHWIANGQKLIALAYTPAERADADDRALINMASGHF